jgi:hypothetical protein
MDWLRFDPDPDSGILRVEILVGRLIELQPDTLEETDEFCKEIYPILDKITKMCLTHDLKQVCTANMDDVDMTRIKPVTMMRIIWNTYEHTKACILLQKCEVSGGGSFFNTLVDAVKGFLPHFMRGMIVLI